MNKEQLQGLLNQKYNPENWNKIYGSIFPNVMLFASPKEITVSEPWVKSFKQRGLVRLDGNQDVAIFEVVLQDGISVQSKRVGLRNLVAKLIDEYQNHGVLAVFDNGSPEYRFTFAAKETKVTREGIEKSETDSKRYTYILGETETCKTAAEQFIKLAEKGTAISLTDLRDAFSVEKLSKQFFNEYKEQYNHFVGYLASQPRILKSVFGDDEKKMRDFVKLLLGRLVFLQFVQKKKWLGVPAKNKDWHSGDVRFLVNAFNVFANKDKFYSDYLEELFFDCLNNPNRKNEIFELSGTKVPFLNGGLFENDNAKTKNLNFPATYFTGLFEFFGKYNFTIDENDPTEKEVGIDPEMLGSIFENLLEDNKDKGAFYTPKEIVHYMCQESLIEYLNTKVNEKQDEGISESIRVFITKRKTDEQILKLISPLAIALREVKICDPAIGSGAFPMGMLMEIFHAVFELFNSNPKIVSKEWNMNGWQPNIVKSNIIQNSIYGVDIEKGAVDIARLRFWLSLIVDEEEPKALPNLDYKIVVGNSLVSKLGDDIIDIDWTLNETSHGLFGADLAKQKGDLLKKISKEQKEFFNPDSDKKKLAAEIRKLKIDLLITQLELMISTKGIEKQPTGSGATIAKQTEIYLKTSGWKSTVKELQKLKAKSDLPLQYFDWKLDFPEVMNDQVAFNVGFDIVIGNPPYVGHKGGMKELFRNLKDTPLGKKFNNERMDVFYYFFHLSLNLSNNKGIIGFITTNYYLTADSAVKLRKDFKERSRIIKLVNFNELKVFESAMGQHNIMTFLTKNIERKSCSIININKKGFADSEHINRILENQDTDTLYYQQNNQDLFDGDKCYIRLQNSTTSPSNSNVILEKIKASKELLGKYCNISQGIVTGIDKVGPKHILRHKEFVENKGDGIYVISQAEKSSIGNSKLIKPWFKNSDIKRYFVAEKPTKWLIHTSVEVNLADYPNIEEHLTYFKKLITGRNYESGELSKAKRLKRWWALSSSRWEFDFDAPKIVSPQRSYSNTFAYTEKSWYASADVYFISEKENGLSLKYLLGILNSRLIYFWLYNRGKRKGEMLELYLTPISEIPIKKPSRIELKIIEDLVNEILTLKKNNPTLDTTKIEIKIDNLVYKLYELTYDEVKVIDPEFSLSKKEYEAIKLE